MRTPGWRSLLFVVAALSASGALAAQRRTSILTGEEIERAKGNISTAYEAVEILRPRWLQRHELARIPGTPQEPLQDTSIRVFLNDHDMGPADYLKTISAGAILEMRWLSANEAASRYGASGGQAAIAVTLKR